MLYKLKKKYKENNKVGKELGRVCEEETNGFLYASSIMQPGCN